MRLHQNTVLITGGSSGIGLELAKKLLSLDNEVIITGRNLEKLEKAKAENPQLIIFQGDIADEGGMKNLSVLFNKITLN